MKSILPPNAAEIPMPADAVVPCKPPAALLDLIKYVPVVTEHDGSRWLDYDWLEAQLAM